MQVLDITIIVSGVAFAAFLGGFSLATWLYKRRISQLQEVADMSVKVAKDAHSSMVKQARDLKDLNALVKKTLFLNTQP